MNLYIYLTILIVLCVVIYLLVSHFVTKNKYKSQLAGYMYVDFSESKDKKDILLAIDGEYVLSLKPGTYVTLEIKEMKNTNKK